MRIMQIDHSDKREEYKRISYIRNRMRFLGAWAIRVLHVYKG